MVARGLGQRPHDQHALPNSVVWYCQEVARRIGSARMQAYVDRFAYGNRDILGEIDQFWLTGGLRISPEEQVDFLQRF
jgi:beta-lactamase class D